VNIKYIYGRDDKRDVPNPALSKKSGQIQLQPNFSPDLPDANIAAAY